LELLLAKTKLRDIIVVLPGITGSVLQKDGKDVWSANGRAVWQGATNWERLVESLALKGEDDGREDLGDGVKATALMRDAILIPGFFGIDGYNRLSAMINEYFDVIPGELGSPKPANFFEFPYDWRRDNRVSAGQLKRLIDQALPAWIEYTGNAQAKIILIAHSMGGLISRYWLEVLDGWKHSRALITLGTPYHGAPGALNYLTNGYKFFAFDITRLARSCLAAYQLLPTYRVVSVGGEPHHIAAVPELPNLQPAYISNAEQFHEEIRDAVAKHKEDAQYLANRYAIIPVVGIGQDTLQSARWQGGNLTSSKEIPLGMEAIFAEGDGTVPRISAIADDQRDEGRDCYVIERHASLQTNRDVLQNVRRKIEQMQSKGLQTLRGGLMSAAERPGLKLAIEDAYKNDQDIHIGVSLIRPTADAGDAVGTRVDGSVTELRATVVRTSDGETIFDKRQSADTGATFAVGILPAGIYRTTIEGISGGQDSPTPITELFAVCD
jgi:pimeloyl-ACP methyl ester carboxylesterase